MKLLPFAALLAAVAMTGCVSNGSSDSEESAAAGAPDAKEAIASAETALEKADSVGYQWRDSGKLLDNAKDALKAGDHEKAANLANEAKRQGELAYAQYEDQKDVTGSN